MKLLSGLNRTDTYRSPGDIKAERQRRIDNSVTRNIPAPGAARPSASLIAGRKLRG